MADLIHDLILRSAERAPENPALSHKDHRQNFGQLAGNIRTVAHELNGLGLTRDERVAVYLEKRPEAVIGLFSAAAAGGVFVPVNPLLKPPQVGYILRDCNVRVLITSASRLSQLGEELRRCHDLHTVIVTDGVPAETPQGLHTVAWGDWTADSGQRPCRRIDTDMAAILYTSGSTGQPKGVVLSHRNMVAGARSVASYLDNREDDRLLAALPLSFDYGLSQLTTAFHSGASVSLMNYLLPRDVLRAVEREQITGLAAVPPLWIQLAQLDWPGHVTDHLRYITNSGGAMPRTTVQALRASLPRTQVYLMYGLTEAFRSTYLPPEEVDRRPDSMGKAIPNAEIMVLREDGSPCAPNEPGELVHRGALVSMGYWNAPEKTAERFRPLPPRSQGITTPELAVWSGDTVRMDDDGFLYFVGRRDEMIKTSGYRVSPSEVEEVVYATGLVAEAVALGVPHPTLGEAIVLVAQGRDQATPDTEALIAACKRDLPTFMVPAHVEAWRDPLPRNANGKIDRKGLREPLKALFAGDRP